MIATVIVLTLLTLLVATDVDPNDPHLSAGNSSEA